MKWDFWNIVFTSSGFLGLYISLILILRHSRKNNSATLMGVHLGCIAIILIYLSYGFNFLSPVDQQGNTIAGGALFIYGPSIYLAYYPRHRRPGFGMSLLQLMYALLVFTLFLYLTDKVNLSRDTINLAGGIYTGIYLLLSVYRLERIENKSDKVIPVCTANDNYWKKHYLYISVLACILIVLATTMNIHWILRFITCSVLTTVILYIWTMIIWIYLNKKTRTHNNNNI